MLRKLIGFNLFVCFLICCFLISCNSDQNLLEPETEKGTVKFNFSSISQDLSKSTDVQNVSAVVITLKDPSGNIIYNQHKLDLFNINGEYLSGPLALNVAQGYNLTEFFVIDENDKVAYVSPKQDSKMAVLVKNPLEISFEIKPNKTTNIIPQVVSVENATAADFGYVTFEFDYVKSIKLLIQAFAYNKVTSTFVPTTAALTITSPVDTLFAESLADTVNMFPLKDTLTTYNIKVEKFNYKTYSKTFTAEELKAYTSLPLIVNLEESPSNQLVLVEAGSFVMGDTNEYRKPAFNVTLTKDYYIGKFEVTNREYCNMLNFAYEENDLEIEEYVVRSNKGNRARLLHLIPEPDVIKFTDNKFVIDPDKQNYPVRGVTWEGAAFYCNMLSRQEGFTELYSLTTWECEVHGTVSSYRLATEAEWEFAALGGNASQGYLYSGSNNPDNVAWYSGNSGSELHPVGLKAPNELGIYDMSGNDWEYVNDWHSSYTSDAKTNPTGPSDGFFRTRRGGGNYNDAFLVESKSRSQYDHIAFYHHSFRIVKYMP